MRYFFLKERSSSLIERKMAINLESYIPPRSAQRGRFEKLRVRGYALTWFLKPLRKLINRSQQNAVFLWIPRTGGTSFYTALAKHGCSHHRRIDIIHYRFAQTGLVTFSHADYNALLEHGFVEPQFDETAYKFAIVRNPYDRLISLYHYFIKQRDLHPKTSFSTFCRLLREDAIDDIGIFNVNGMSQCQPQCRWLKDKNGKLIPDYVGKFETLAESYKTIMAHLGIQEELPNINGTVHKPYQEYYSAEDIEIVNEFYREDFEEFGYKYL
jgi:hypothetical protein